MNPIRNKLGWILLLTSWLAGGCAPHGEAGTEARARKQAESAPPPAAPGPAATPAAPVPAGPKPAAGDELPRIWPWSGDEEDEFEGEGWTFWPLGGH